MVRLENIMVNFCGYQSNHNFIVPISKKLVSVKIEFFVDKICIFFVSGNPGYLHKNARGPHILNHDCSA